MKTTMTVAEFESRVWELEGIRVVIRAGGDEEVDIYDYHRRTKWSQILSYFCLSRIETRVKGKQFVVIDGYGKQPDGRNTLVGNVRSTYTKGDVPGEFGSRDAMAVELAVELAEELSRHASEWLTDRISSHSTGQNNESPRD